VGKVILLIHGVYLIDEKSGTNLLFRKYGELDMDETLISGFLTAIRHFSSELKREKEPNRVQEIEMETYKIVYAFEGEVLAVAIVDRGDSTPLVRSALKKLAASFSNDYAAILREWNGDVSIFKDFLPKLDEILMDGKIGEQVKKPKLKRKLMKSMVRIGFISEIAFLVGELCDGKKSRDFIASELGMPLEKVIEALGELEKKDLIEWV